MTLCLDTPSANAATIADICDAAVDGPAGMISIPTDGGAIDLRTPDEQEGAVAGRFASFSVVVASLDVVRRLLDEARVPYRSRERSIEVAAEQTFGVTIVFRVDR